MYDCNLSCKSMQLQYHSEKLLLLVHWNIIIEFFSQFGGWFKSTEIFYVFEWIIGNFIRYMFYWSYYRNRNILTTLVIIDISETTFPSKNSFALSYIMKGKEVVFKTTFCAKNTYNKRQRCILAIIFIHGPKFRSLSYTVILHLHILCMVNVLTWRKSPWT